jgi:arabinose-5-phosphate isomerase
VVSVTSYNQIIKDVLSMEADALLAAKNCVSEDNAKLAVEIFNRLNRDNGTLYFLGVGKSGLVARKLASTFSSLGLPSFFLHPTEALHGDMGRIRSVDAVVLLSKSGTTEELLKLMPFMPVDQTMTIGLLGELKSPISEKCGVVFDCSVKQEACVNNQAPTASSTLALGMGDALAVLYESITGLSREGFAVNHPGGILGKSLRMKVSDLMWGPTECPVGGPDSTLQDVILLMTQKNLGGCAVVDSDSKFLGIIVEGDIRRTFTRNNRGLSSTAAEVMNSSPVTITQDSLAHDALLLMEHRDSQITILPVVDNSGIFLGFIRLHDLLKEGFGLK